MFYRVMHIETGQFLHRGVNTLQLPLERTFIYSEYEVSNTPAKFVPIYVTSIDEVIRIFNTNRPPEMIDFGSYHIYRTKNCIEQFCLVEVPRNEL